MASEQGQVRALVERAIEAQTEVGIVIAGERRYVTNRQKLADIRAAADALDARTQATPITQEALRERGWEIDLDTDDWGNWTAFVMAGAIIIDAEVVAGGSVHISIMSGNTQTYLPHIHTMQQLSQLIELLTGQPTPGGGDSRE